MLIKTPGPVSERQLGPMWLSLRIAPPPVIEPLRPSSISGPRLLRNSHSLKYRSRRAIPKRPPLDVEAPEPLPHALTFRMVNEDERFARIARVLFPRKT